MSDPGVAKTTLGGSATGVDDVAITRQRRWVWPAVIVIGLGAGAGVWKSLGARRGAVVASPAAAPPATATQADPPARPVPPVPREPAVAPAPKMIAVALTSRPAGANVIRERDGAVLGKTPFSTSWLAGAGVEKLRLERVGFRSHPVTVTLDRGLDIDVELRPVAAPLIARPKHELRPSPAAATPPPKPAEPAAPAPASAPPATPPAPPVKRDPVAI